MGEGENFTAVGSRQFYSGENVNANFDYINHRNSLKFIREAFQVHKDMNDSKNHSGYFSFSPNPKRQPFGSGQNRNFSLGVYWLKFIVRYGGVPDFFKRFLMDALTDHQLMVFLKYKVVPPL